MARRVAAGSRMPATCGMPALEARYGYAPLDMPSDQASDFELQPRPAASGVAVPLRGFPKREACF
jgi:hypothetical protein